MARSLRARAAHCFACVESDLVRQHLTTKLLLVLSALHVYRTLPEKGDLLLHLVMFHNVVPRYLDSINDVLWSIPFEWQFYLVFPLLFIVLRRTNLVALYVIAALLALVTTE